jgi:hypothetical protein
MNTDESERSIEDLLKLAGEREMPSHASMERARRAAHESWRRGLAPVEKDAAAPRRWLKLSLGLAAAAGIAAVLIAIGTGTNEAPVLVARVSAADDGAVLRAKVSSPVRVPADVHSGALLSTAGGRVALTLGDALSLRVDRNTRLRFDAADRVTLLAGSLYVDSGGINAVPTLRIATPAGEVRHVGTQFQVSVSSDYTRVRVREGRVLLTPRDAQTAHDIGAGDELEVVGNQARLRHDLPAYGTDWEWATFIAPSFPIENRPLAEFLAWLTREHGWQLRYSEESVQQRTHEIRLHGTLAGLDADGMIERVSLITGLPLAQRDGALVVGAEARR